MTEPKNQKPQKPVTQYDPALPLYAVLHQSPTKNTTAFFQGEGAEEEAMAQAEALARTTKRPAIVFGPQAAAFGPPAEVATQIRLIPA